MNKTVRIVKLSLLVFCLLLLSRVEGYSMEKGGDLFSSDPAVEKRQMEDGRIIFKLRDGFEKGQSSGVVSREAMEQRENRLSSMARNALNSSGLDYSDLKTYSQLGMSSARIEDLSVEKLQSFAAMNDVEWVEPVHRRYLYEEEPEDELFGKQWHLKNEGSSSLAEELSQKGDWKVFSLKKDADLNVFGAWDITSGDKDIIVAVMDSGVDYKNVDLRDSMWTNAGEIPGNGIDDDKNGFVDDVHGCNGNRMFNTGCHEGDPMDDSKDSGHGTHVAGAVAASANGVGSVGVAPNVKIMGLRIADDRGYLTTAAIIEAGNYLLNQKRYHDTNVRAVNMSFGGPFFSKAEREMIRQMGEAGIMVFVAAGNDGRDSDFFPANYPANLPEPNILTVGASDGNGEAACFSETGAVTVDVFAPGHGIVSTVAAAASDDIKDYDDGNGSYWGIMSGTSMASPVAMGVGALAWSVNKEASWRDIKGLLMKSVTELDSMKGLSRSGGRLNAFKAVTTSLSDDPIIFDLQVEGSAEGSDVIKVEGVNLDGASSAELRVGDQTRELTVSEGTSTDLCITLPAHISFPDARAVLTITTAKGSASVPFFVASRGGNSPFPKKEKSFASFTPYKDRCVRIGQYVYGIGYEYAGYVSVFGVYKLNLNNNTVKLIVKNIPDDLYFRESVPVLFRGKIYFIGGSSTGKVYCLNPENEFFYPLKDTLQPGVEGYLIGASLASDEQYIYLAGGWFFNGDKKYDSDQTKVYRWTPGTTDWQEIADMPDTNRLGIQSAALVDDGKLILAGGRWSIDRDRRGELDTVNVLDLEDFTWATGKLPFSARMGNLVRIDDVIYYWGATNASRGYNGSPYIACADCNSLDGNWRVLDRCFDFLGLQGDTKWGISDQEKLYLMGNNFEDRHAVFSVKVGENSSSPLSVSDLSFSLDKESGLRVEKVLSLTGDASLFDEFKSFLKKSFSGKILELGEDQMAGARLNVSFAEGETQKDFYYQITGEIKPQSFPMLLIRNSATGELQRVDTGFDRKANRLMGTIKKSYLTTSARGENSSVKIENFLILPTVKTEEAKTASGGGGCNVGGFSFMEMLSLIVPLICMSLLSLRKKA